MVEQQERPRALTIHVISDSVGDSASTIATAAVSQFVRVECSIERLPNVTRIEQIATYIEQQLDLMDAKIAEGVRFAHDRAGAVPGAHDRAGAVVGAHDRASVHDRTGAQHETSAPASPTGNSPADTTPNASPTADAPDAQGIDELVVFYTIANPELCRQFEEYVVDKNVAAIDLLGPAIGAIAEATGETPLGKPGLIRKTDKDYFDRVEAMEFAVDHDDGRNPEGLTDADIVLIGSSRTSKTPLSIYLAVQGYRVANVPLAPGTAPPPQLFDVEPRRVFGLMSKVDLLSEIRFRRLGKAAPAAASYADPASVQSDLDEARAIMRRIGCIVVRTDNRAIEETAQEILRYYEVVTPRANQQ